MVGEALKITATTSVMISETTQTDNTVHIVHTVTLTMTRTGTTTTIRDETNDPIIMITDKMTNTKVILIKMKVIKLDPQLVVLVKSMSKFKTDLRQAPTIEITEATTIETIAVATTAHETISITSGVEAAMTTIINTTEKKMAMKDQQGQKVHQESSHQMDKTIRKMISRLKDDSF